jgi:hypothetical protein
MIYDSSVNTIHNTRVKNTIKEASNDSTAARHYRQLHHSAGK